MGTKAWATVVALGVHGAVLGALAWVPMKPDGGADPVRDGGISWFRLEALPEGNSALFMPLARNSDLPPPGVDGLPDASPLGGKDFGTGVMAGADPVGDAELAELLAADREALQAELDRMTQVASAAPRPVVPVPPPPSQGNTGGSDKGPEGAVRELNLEGFPQRVVDDIMDRYELRVVMKEMQAGRMGQNFLSSASRGPGEHYFGGATVAAGVYEVFQLSRNTVALMSRLEEEAIRERGMDPLQTRVIRIVFGIVETESGGYKLGVQSLELEKVAP